MNRRQSIEEVCTRLCALLGFERQSHQGTLIKAQMLAVAQDQAEQDLDDFRRLLASQGAQPDLLARLDQVIDQPEPYQDDEVRAA